MNFLIRTLGKVTLWLERRFPEKMTTNDVMAKFVEYETRVAFLERQEELKRLRAEVQKLFLEINKVKLFNGIAQITGVNGE